ncbi:MAG TPA: acyl-[ACP]--phospholipid O-acyltransferase [Verrucomicrobiae bacterium]|jgi:acyl-[acyl-carrier-protein]-phospholipid O-acyltransferase/long-chain-fatty-acid--[acyl-carrier-protein] ligase
MPETPISSKESYSTRGFWSLFVTQFQGAFSDYVLKNLVVFMMLALNVSAADKFQIGEWVTALYSLPFILFSMAGGHLADRFSKRNVMIAVKIFEVIVMLFALVGFLSHDLKLLLAGVFLMGIHSAVFGPSKYGSLPEQLPTMRLSWGNGLLELGTFVAVILGTVVAGVLSDRFHQQQAVSGILLVGLAGMGLLCSFGVARVPATNPTRTFQINFLEDLWQRIKTIRGDRPLKLAVIGNVYFSFLGALLLLNLFFYGAEVLHVDETRIGFLNCALALGIGLGSVAAGFLSGNKIETGLIPFGAAGLSITCIGIFFAGSMTSAIIWLAVMGFAGGFFIVPISALLQHRPDPARKGEIIAASNLLAFVGVFLVWPAHYLLARVMHMTPQGVFLFSGILTLAGTAYTIYLLPDALLHFMLWVATRTLYRIRVMGRKNIPERGGALFVCNHLSFIDAMFLLASVDRPVRFIMYKHNYDLPWIRPFARAMGVIPISSEMRPRELIQSLRTASEAIQAGEVVCIFAEGQVTRIGQMLPFRRGFERIMKDVNAPIIPVGLDGVWGSLFSFKGGGAVWKLPRQIPYPITVNYGEPMPHDANPMTVRQRVQELVADAWSTRRKGMRTIHRSFVRTVRKHPFRFFMADGQNAKVSYLSALTRTIFLARRLRGHWHGQEKVGMLLPPSVPGSLANFAALLMGKVPVNLNYTVSEEVLVSCINQCEIKTVLTSKTFLEKVKLKVPAGTLFIEDLAANPGTMEKFTAMLAAILLPVSLLEQWCGTTRKVGLDDLVTIIFSSGSTGAPKGVLLSHYNIASNIEQLEQVFGLQSSDGVLGILPFFHSFGFTGTLCLPAMLGVRAVYHPNPLDSRNIGQLVSQYSLSFLLATPTFLQFYIRGCTAEAFGSLRIVMTGAEKLPDRVSAAFEEHFGLRPLEGYGCSECSPAVAVNTQDYRAAGFRQVGSKRGKIGHPLPGICVRIEDPDTHVPVSNGQSGLLLVRGPNVMQGYLGQPEKTAAVLHDGWYVTGDIANQDEDGFLQITDRLSRFSKIGGEMVPHIKVEEKLHELAGSTEQTFVVVGVPDQKKGERLVVLHRLSTESLSSCIEKLAQCDLPNIWKPRPDQFYKVEKFPYLGTGKLDLRAVKNEAEKFSVEKSE